MIIRINSIPTVAEVKSMVSIPEGALYTSFNKENGTVSYEYFVGYEQFASFKDMIDTVTDEKTVRILKTSNTLFNAGKKELKEHQNKGGVNYKKALEQYCLNNSTETGVDVVCKELAWYGTSAIKTPILVMKGLRFVVKNENGKIEAQVQYSEPKYHPTFGMVRDVPFNVGTIEADYEKGKLFLRGSNVKQSMLDLDDMGLHATVTAWIDENYVSRGENQEEYNFESSVPAKLINESKDKLEKAKETLVNKIKRADSTLAWIEKVITSISKEEETK